MSIFQTHGWHVIGELAFLLMVSVFTFFYIRAMIRGRTRAVVCASCGRVASRANSWCPRCKAPMAPPDGP